jgi:hypothetical protein
MHRLAEQAPDNLVRVMHLRARVLSLTGLPGRRMRAGACWRTGRMGGCRHGQQHGRYTQSDFHISLPF